MPRPACFDFQTLHANPAEEQGGIWIVVGSAGTMSHFTGYPTLLANRDGRFKRRSFVTTGQSDLSGQRLQRFQKIVRDGYALDSGSHYRLRSGLAVA